MYIANSHVRNSGLTMAVDGNKDHSKYIKDAVEKKKENKNATSKICLSC